jgi:hypothetical protein
MPQLGGDRVGYETQASLCPHWLLRDIWRPWGYLSGYSAKSIGLEKEQCLLVSPLGLPRCGTLDMFLSLSGLCVSICN